MKGMQPINDDFYIDRSKELGKGNYGIVYKGYHLSSNRIIAIKHIDRQMVDRLPSHEREINVMA